MLVLSIVDNISAMFLTYKLRNQLPLTLSGSIQHDTQYSNVLQHFSSTEHPVQEKISEEVLQHPSSTFESHLR